MDAPIRQCPGCNKLGFEWVEKHKSGWCLYCGYFEYFSSVELFLEPDDSDEIPL